MAEDDRVRPDDLTATRSVEQPMSETETRRLDEPVAASASDRTHGEPAFMDSDAEAPTRRVDTPADSADAPTQRVDAAAQAPTRRLDQPVGPAPTERSRGDDDTGAGEDRTREHAVWRDERETAEARRPAKTSAAALFGFLFGFSALITAFLGPVAVVFGLLGLVLGIVGKRRTDAEARVSGRVVAITGIVLAVLGLLLGLAVTVAVGLYANDPAVRDALSEAVDVVRDALQGLPSFGL